MIYKQMQQNHCWQDHSILEQVTLAGASFLYGKEQYNARKFYKIIIHMIQERRWLKVNKL